MPLLSILVPRLACRDHYFALLYDCLQPQWGTDVVLITLRDDGDEPAGTKRNRLLEMADTEFVTFIDDDDLVADDYCERIVTELRDGRPDIVGFRQRIYDDGKFTKSKALTGKALNHLCPIRREIALDLRYPDCNAGDDVDYGNRLAERTLTEAFIDAELYFYRRRSDRRWEKLNEED